MDARSIAHPTRREVLAGMVGLAAAPLLPARPSVAAAIPAITLIRDAANGKELHASGDIRRRLPPASSFKVPLAVMGYDAGILVDTTTPAWPYKPEYDAPERVRKTVDPTIWERDSVVWYSQELTRRLGAERFADYVKRFDYGNADVSGDPGKNNGLTRAWLGSSLLISAEEQVAFLRRLVDGTLPVSTIAQEKARAIIPAFPAGEGWSVRGKTGSVDLRDASGRRDPNRPIGWFVGWAEGTDGRRVVFARALLGNKPPELGLGLDARESLLKDLPGLLAG
ncbi:class D beta-lactamase [Ancylobacter terrae]|uniref:class D beta-lactamase n=1 Tax=Ancylobacter sp. sgz301288 TaxID=3342077 RepID=UPI00385C6B23